MRNPASNSPIGTGNPATHTLRRRRRRKRGSKRKYWRIESQEKINHKPNNSTCSPRHTHTEAHARPPRAICEHRRAKAAKQINRRRRRNGERGAKEEAENANATTGQGAEHRREEKPEREGKKPSRISLF
ncbi:hypothetical protein PAHAL_3G229900 [Panicum hallii]|uniref:Uncharacterized protein n=1 Tax=Panicum hallii TaxID=206008 RepID=A0A2S3HAW7_9POAL|nr:hypothetical protein PAHAL_3G229900 [Panicum hallii]